MPCERVGGNGDGLRQNPRELGSRSGRDDQLVSVGLDLVGVTLTQPIHFQEAGVGLGE